MRDWVLKGVSQFICDMVEQGRYEHDEGLSIKLNLIKIDNNPEKYGILQIQKHDYQTGEDYSIFEVLMTEKHYKNLFKYFIDVNFIKKE